MTATIRPPIIRPWQPRDRAGVPALILPIQTAEFGLPATLEGQPDLLDPVGVYRQGGGEARLGQRLLDTAIAHARARGFRAITLGTTEAFKAAHRFYERNGFRRIEQDALPPGFPVFALGKRFYRLALG